MSTNPSESAAIQRLEVAGIFLANENFTHIRYSQDKRINFYNYESPKEMISRRNPLFAPFWRLFPAESTANAR